MQGVEIDGKKRFGVGRVFQVVGAANANIRRPAEEGNFVHCFYVYCLYYQYLT